MDAIVARKQEKTEGSLVFKVNNNYKFTSIIRVYGTGVKRVVTIPSSFGTVTNLK